MPTTEIDTQENSLHPHHSFSPQKTFKLLDSSLNGLTTSQAQLRLKRHGLNELTQKETISPLVLFLNQFNNPLLAILGCAILVSIYLQEYLNAFVIFGIILLNGILGFIQEYRAEKALDMLRRMTILQAKVFRDNKKINIDSTQLVPGDIIFLEAGDKIPADAQIIECSNLQTIESSLTGESVPVDKTAQPSQKDSLLAERKNILYCTTSVTNGQAKAIITTTGMNTEIGKIATSIEKVSLELTPFQEKIETFGKYLSLSIFGIALFIFVIGILKGLGWQIMLLTAIALAVAAIPEGLPAIITIALALGVQRMLSVNVLIRRLPSVETLGSTTVICTDKTGTLTCNNMTVCKLWYNTQEYTIQNSLFKQNNNQLSQKQISNLHLLLKIGVLCNNAQLEKKSSLGDPTETALLISAQAASLDQTSLSQKEPRIEEISFTSERKMMTTIHKTTKGKVAYVKGSVEHLLKHCTHILLNGKPIPLTLTQRQQIRIQEKQFAKESLRVLGFAYNPHFQYSRLHSHKNRVQQQAEKNLIFVGMQAMEDPLRDGVKQAIEQCHSAGIKVIMITGDHLEIAKSIAAQLNIPGKAINGHDLKKIDLEKEIESIGVIARVNPEDKLKIVEALQKLGHSVAMTGDGVNDAPAIKKAQIGISMGKTGTDVAKESSDMILLDDNFASIVHAIEQGRAIFQRIKTFILYLFSGNIAEIFLILLCVLLNIPLALLAIQILWINVVTETIPAIALSVEKSKPDVMTQKPTPKNEPLLKKIDIYWILCISLLITIGTFSIYYYTLNGHSFSFNALSFDAKNPNYPHALTMAFTTFVLFQMFNIINNKFHSHATFTKHIWQNGWLGIGILSVMILQILIIYVPFLNPIFSTIPLTLKDWTLSILIASSILWIPAIHRRIQSIKNISTQ